MPQTSFLLVAVLSIMLPDPTAKPTTIATIISHTAGPPSPTATIDWIAPGALAPCALAPSAPWARVAPPIPVGLADPEELVLGLLVLREGLDQQHGHENCENEIFHLNKSDWNSGGRWDLKGQRD